MSEYFQTYQSGRGHRLKFVNLQKLEDFLDLKMSGKVLCAATVIRTQRPCPRKVHHMELSRASETLKKLETVPIPSRELQIYIKDLSGHTSCSPRHQTNGALNLAKKWMDRIWAEFLAASGVTDPEIQRPSLELDGGPDRWIACLNERSLESPDLAANQPTNGRHITRRRSPVCGGMYSNPTSASSAKSESIRRQSLPKQPDIATVENPGTESTRNRPANIRQNQDSPFPTSRYITPQKKKRLPSAAPIAATSASPENDGNGSAIPISGSGFRESPDIFSTPRDIMPNPSPPVSITSTPDSVQSLAPSFQFEDADAAGTPLTAESTPFDGIISRRSTLEEMESPLANKASSRQKSSREKRSLVCDLSPTKTKRSPTKTKQTPTKTKQTPTPEAKTSFQCSSNLKFNLYRSRIDEGVEASKFLGTVRDGAFGPTGCGGYIYIFRCPRHEEMLKIGFTAGDQYDSEPEDGTLLSDMLGAGSKFAKHPAVQRIAKWLKCGHEIRVMRLFYVPCAASRVESLVHRSLVRYRRQEEPCRACKPGGPGPRHDEWFQLDEDTACAAIDVWVEFGNKIPYNSDGYLTRFWQRQLLVDKNGRTAGGSSTTETAAKVWLAYMQKNIADDEEHERSSHVVKNFKMEIDLQVVLEGKQLVVRIPGQQVRTFPVGNMDEIV